LFKVSTGEGGGGDAKVEKHPEFIFQDASKMRNLRQKPKTEIKIPCTEYI